MCKFCESSKWAFTCKNWPLYSRERAFWSYSKIKEFGELLNARIRAHSEGQCYTEGSGIDQDEDLAAHQSARRCWRSCKLEEAFVSSNQSAKYFLAELVRYLPAVQLAGQLAILVSALRRRSRLSSVPMVRAVKRQSCRAVELSPMGTQIRDKVKTQVYGIFGRSVLGTIEADVFVTKYSFRSIFRDTRFAHVCTAPK